MTPTRSSSHERPAQIFSPVPPHDEEEPEAGDAEAPAFLDDTDNEEIPPQDGAGARRDVFALVNKVLRKEIKGKELDPSTMLMPTSGRRTFVFVPCALFGLQRRQIQQLEEVIGLAELHATPLQSHQHIHHGVAATR